MSEGAWRFRTTDGVVTVEPDAITTRSTPARFLSGLAVRWRRGTLRGRLTVAVLLAGFLFSVAGFAYHVWLALATGLAWSTALYASSVGVFGYSLWTNYARRTVIRRDELRSIELDADARELTVTHQAGDGLLSAFREDVAQTTLTLGTDEDLRAARETLRLRGFDVETATVDDTEIEHRLVTEAGGSFCEHCRVAVSPNDKTCPACGYTLWVETSVGT